VLPLSKARSHRNQVTRTPGRNERDRLPVEDHLAHAQAELQGPAAARSNRSKTPAGREKRTGCMTSARHRQLTANRPRTPGHYRDEKRLPHGHSRAIRFLGCWRLRTIAPGGNCVTPGGARARVLAQHGELVRRVPRGPRGHRR